MVRLIVWILLLPGLFPNAQAGVAYRFDITAAYAASDPFPNRIDGAVSGPATGYLQIANTGDSDYRGILRVVAFSETGGDMGFNTNDGLIPAGGAVSIGMPNDSSVVGGFNGPAYTFRPGIILYFEGMVSDAADSGRIKIAAQDLDMHSGVFRTDPNGLVTDNFVLQGGDPFGFYNGPAFSLSQAWGHFTFTGMVAEPPSFVLLLTGLGALLLTRSRIAYLPLARPAGAGLYRWVNPLGEVSRRRVFSCRYPFARSRLQASPGRFRGLI